MGSGDGPAIDRVRLIASDLDGTVVGEDFRFRPRTLRALEAARDRGVELLFVTGRPARWLDVLRRELDHQGLVICSNGAVVFDLDTGSMVETHGFPARLAFDVLADVRRAHPEVVCAVETPAGLVAEPAWHSTTVAARRNPPLRYGPLEETVPEAERVLKLLVRSPDEVEDVDAFVARMRSLVDGRLSVTHAVAGMPLAEMGQAGLSKARTLSDYVAALGIAPDQVMAFGDMPNDLEMLTWAGYGFAMGDGHPGVVSAVGRTAPPFGKDGVAQVVEALLDGDSLDAFRRQGCPFGVT